MGTKETDHLGRFLASATQPLSVGPFELIRPLGKGSSAPVWLAREVWAGVELRQVAIKLFAAGGIGAAHGPDSASPSISPRVVQVIHEAQALCKISHPNVVKYHTLVRSDDHRIFGLVMEQVDGDSLDTSLAKEGRLGVGECIEIGMAAAAALAALHAVDVVHRDVKPANLVEASGVYKLIDFGIAWAGSPASVRDAGATVLVDDLPLEMPVTEQSSGSGSVETGLSPYPLSPGGTLGYFDPTCMNEPAAPASDLYALGATLFECLTGMIPARASAHVQGLAGTDNRVLKGELAPPSVRAVSESIPAALSDLVASMLEPDRSKRPSSAEVVLADLERIRWARQGRSVELPPVEAGPFRGLQSYEPEHQGVYFGRSVEIAACLEFLRGHALITLVGPSGCGKSSLARAGLLPAIVDGRLGSWPKAWDTAILTPGKTPREAIRQALAETLTLPAEASAEAWVDLLTEHVRTGARGIVLVMDQLEEVVALGDADGQAFVSSFLSAWARQVRPGLRCVATVRHDFLPSFIALGDIGQTLGGSMYRVAPLDGGAWLDVLELSLAAYGHRLENASLRNRLRTDLEACTDAMPLVQYALSELWRRRRDDKVVPEAALDDIGGIRGALELHAEETYTTLCRHGATPDAVRAVLVGLTTPQATRSTLARSELVSALPADLRGSAPEIIDALHRSRLLVADAEGVRLAHEHLLTSWARLTRWMSDLEGARQLAQELEKDALGWMRERSRERLWRGTRLSQAIELTSHRDILLSEPAQKFLRAARRARSRGYSIVVAVCASVLIGGSALTGLYIKNIDEQRQDAEDARKVAEDAGREADKARQLASVKEQEAVREEDKARKSQEEAASARDESKKLAQDYMADLVHIAEARGGELEKQLAELRRRYSLSAKKTEPPATPRSPARRATGDPPD